MNLTVLVDAHDADDRPTSLVTGQEPRARLDPVGLPCVRQGRPAKAHLVLRVEIRRQIDLDLIHTPPSLLPSQDS